MPLYDLKWQLARSIAAFWNHPELTAQVIHQDFSSPPNIAMGHLALPCFRVAKLLKKPTQEITKELATRLSNDELTVTAAGPYANFKWKLLPLYSKTLQEVANQKDGYGRDDIGKQRRVLIEYCSPNIAKKLAFHHIRSTLIGNSLANVYEALGFKTERMNFVGDWGSQFARLLAAVELWGDRSKLSMSNVPASMAHLSEIYVRFHKDLESHPDRLEKAADCLKRLESGETKSTELWKNIRDISLSAMEATLKRMSVRFDLVEGESHYVQHIGPIIDEVKAKADARLSEGAWIVEVEEISTPALIQKRDGTTLYLTRDIAAAIDRYKRFSFHKMFYVVSEQQKLHFQLLFGVLKRMGYAWSDSCEHLSFGTVLFGSEKMSTREGRVVLLDEVLEEAKALALAECTAKNPSLANKEDVAEAVGFGAIIFGELSVHRQRDLEFDWKAILAFDGETGPYVQYAHVRCQSLLEKAREKGELSPTVPAATAYEFSQEEETLILTIARLRAVLHHVIQENEPFHLAHYLIDLAKSFNKFYYRFPVLQASDPEQRNVRLALVSATQQALANGLKLLGVPVPKEM